MIVPGWLRYSSQLLLGMCVGVALTVVCFLVTAPLFFYAAYVIGPVLAFVVFVAFIAPLMARNLRHRISYGIICVLSGVAIVPVGTLISLRWLIFD